jgi:uncharacterized damage-inducible protein DinB
MTTTERKDRIATIGRLPQELTEAVRGLTDEQLDTPYGEGKWTIRQVVHHLADSHGNAMARMRWILAEDNTTLKTYDQEVWAELPDSLTQPVEPSLRLLEGLHQRFVFLLEHVKDDAFSRTADHPEMGKVSLDDLLVVYSDHGERHVGRITGLRQRMGW